MLVGTMTNKILMLLAIFLSSFGYAAVPLHTAKDGSSASAMLGSAGPMGAFGPLATLGPIGENSWNASGFFASLGDWTGLAQLLSENGGPLSADGPLGESGPLGKAAYSATPRDFRAAGVYAIFGPAGPFGPLGPLGPLGPIGAHGSGSGSGTVTIPGGAGDGRFHLVKYYSQAGTHTSFDTSFMAVGAVETDKDAEYWVTSPEKQVVSILVVPEKSLDVFSVSATSPTNDLDIRSDSSTRINWITIEMRAGETVAVHVRLLASAHWLTHSYRLIVIGAGRGR